MSAQKVCSGDAGGIFDLLKEDAPMAAAGAGQEASASTKRRALALGAATTSAEITAEKADLGLKLGAIATTNGRLNEAISCDAIPIPLWIHCEPTMNPSRFHCESIANPSSCIHYESTLNQL